MAASKRSVRCQGDGLARDEPPSCNVSVVFKKNDLHEKILLTEVSLLFFGEIWNWIVAHVKL
jgi:hypothetical protein